MSWKNQTKKQLIDELDRLKLRNEKLETELEQVHFKCRQYFENLPVLTFKKDLDGKILNCNKLAVKTLGYLRKEELIGKPLGSTIYAPNSRAKGKRLLSEWKKTGMIRDQEMELITKQGNTIFVIFNTVTMHSQAGKPLYCLSIYLDITQRKVMEGTLEKSEKELKRKTDALEQKNIALREIIAQIEIEKRRINEEIEANVNLVINPILEQMKNNGSSRKYVDLIMHHINGMISSYGINLRKNSYKLTPREMEICNLIKGGLVNKDISSLLNISSRTIEKHRQKIRGKLGITNMDVNLTSFLLEL